MASPWVKALSNEAGGGFNAAMRANNSLANENVLRQINQIKKQYMPSTLTSEAMSKLAYANLMGPQFLAKMLGNKGIVANMGDPAARAALQKAVQSGMNVGTAGNSLTQIPQGGGNPSYSGIGQPSTNNFSGYIQNALKNIFGKNNSQQQPSNTFSQSMNGSQVGSGKPGHMTPNGYEGSLTGAPAADYYANTGPDRQAEQEAVDRIDRAQNNNNTPMDLEVTQGQRAQHEPTWGEKTGELLGQEKQGEESGKNKSEALKDIGKAQLALSGSGAAQDELIKIIQNPIWQHARDKIPAFQKQQLSVLKVTGNPELRKLVGEYTSAGQAMVASQVAGMGNKHLVREYDLAEKQKINDSDTIESSEGKITNAKNLHDIAVQKNNIIKNLLKKGVDEADAVEQANKDVDVSAIRRTTDKLLERKVSVTNNKTGEKRIMSVKEAQKLGVPNV